MSQPVLPNYDVAFSAIRIRNTRSRHQDTLYIKINVSVDGADKGTVNWDGTGGRDKNNGYYDGLRNANNGLIGTSTGAISDTSVVKVSFLMLNSGYTPNEANYTKALAAIAAAAGKYGTVWGYIGAGLATVFSFLVGANCDGPVGGDSFQITGREIKAGIADEVRRTGNVYYIWSNRYVGGDSPHGCGSNSDYDCLIQFGPHG